MTRDELRALVALIVRDFGKVLWIVALFLAAVALGPYFVGGGWSGTP